MKTKRQTKQKGGNFISQKFLDFEKPQKVYITKKKIVEEKRRVVNERVEGLKENQGQISDVEKFKEIEDQRLEIEQEVGLWEAQEKLRKAERRLANWLFEETNASEELDNFDILKEKWNKNPRTKEKVIDTAMRYNPNKEKK